MAPESPMRSPLLLRISVGLLCFPGHLLCEGADDDRQASRVQLSSPRAVVPVSPASPGSASAPLPTRVVVANTATETELWAAGKLADLLMLPMDDNIGVAAGLSGASQIAVGHGAATALGVPPGALVNLGDDAYLVSTDRGVLVGSVAISSSAHSARGSIHGAFAFLRALGFEFYAENVTRIPSPLPTLPAIDTTYRPSFDSRDLTMASRGIGSNDDRIHTDGAAGNDTVGNCTAIAKAEHWTGGQCQRHGTIWRPGRNLSAALGLNGASAFAPVGGYLAASDPPGGVATAYNLLTPSLNADVPDCAGPGTNEPHAKKTPCPAVFRQHPEWFICMGGACTATTINKTDNGQPCWSAPGVSETMTKNVLRILRADPKIKIVSVSNMDGAVSNSPCPMDMVAAKKENATGGANFYVVRDVAAAVAHEFPNVKIQALAYNGAKAPPKHLVFADNVIVQIAGLGGVIVDVSLHDKENAVALALIKGWLKHATTVYIWKGIPKSVILPHGGHTAQALHIKELAELGVRGYFAEGWTWEGADMADLRVFLAGRMTFDATLDIDTLVAEFLENYYGGGAAAAKVGEYIKLISAAFLTGNSSVDFTGRVLDAKDAHKLGGGPNSSIFTNETLLTGAALLTDALKAATEPQHKERIAYDLMHLQYVLLVRWDSLRLNATAMKKPWPLHDTKAEEYAAFATAYNISGIKSFTETRKQSDGKGHRYSAVKTTLASFHAELFPG